MNLVGSKTRCCAAGFSVWPPAVFHAVSSVRPLKNVVLFLLFSLVCHLPFITHLYACATTSKTFFFLFCTQTLSFRLACGNQAHENICCSKTAERRWLFPSLTIKRLRPVTLEVKLWCYTDLRHHTSSREASFLPCWHPKIRLHGTKRSRAHLSPPLHLPV